MSPGMMKADSFLADLAIKKAGLTSFGIRRKDTLDRTLPFRRPPATSARAVWFEFSFPLPDDGESGECDSSLRSLRDRRRPESGNK